MSQHTPARINRRRLLGLLAVGLLVPGLVVFAAWLVGAGPPQLQRGSKAEQLASEPDRGRQPTAGVPSPPAPSPSEPLLLAPRPPRGDGEIPRDSDDGATTDDGHLPEGATVIDDQYPGIRRLDADLLSALREAARAAADAGVEFEVNSGWRSAKYQERLLRQAIEEYGSREEALRWVTTSEGSQHVSGNAVDLGVQARQWLAEHGAAYGLCQIYANEPWHYELRPDAVDDGCPEMYADAAQDPRVNS